MKAQIEGISNESTQSTEVDVELIPFYEEWYYSFTYYDYKKKEHLTLKLSAKELELAVKFLGDRS